FEADGEVVNNMISSGEYVKAIKFSDKKFVPFTSTQFAVTEDKKLLMEQFVFKGDLILPDGTVENIVRINSNADSNSITLYNSCVTLMFTIKELNSEVSSEISVNYFMLTANNRYAYYLERKINEDDTISIVLKMDPDYGKIYTLTGGWPRIVENGENVIAKE